MPTLLIQVLLFEKIFFSLFPENFSFLWKENLISRRSKFPFHFSSKCFLKLEYQWSKLLPPSAAKAALVELCNKQHSYDQVEFTIRLAVPARFELVVKLFTNSFNHPVLFRCFSVCFLFCCHWVCGFFGGWLCVVFLREGKEERIFSNTLNHLPH